MLFVTACAGQQPASAIPGIIQAPAAIEAPQSTGSVPGTTWSANSPAADQADAPEWLSRTCPRPDKTLGAVASKMAAGHGPGRDGDAVTRALRAAGSAYRDPRVWLLTAPSLHPASTVAVLQQAMLRPPAPAERRCGYGYARHASSERAALIAVDTLADPDEIPLHARTGSWVRIGANLVAVAKAAKFVVAGPTRPPRTLPTSMVGRRVSAVVALDEPGAWLVQLLVDHGAGPTPTLDAAVFVDREPSDTLWLEAAPGEESAAVFPEAGATTASAEAAADSIARMIDRAREGAHVGPLRRVPELDRAAELHARAMLRTHRLAHDVGGGDPIQRLAGLGIVAAEIGENLAHAASPALAHRALWYSPSHRLNLLGERFRRVGIGTATESDGTVWVAELFATP